MSPADRRARPTLAGTLVVVAGGQIIIIQPAFVQGLVDYRGVSAAQAGYLLSVEMMALAIVTLAMTWLASRAAWPRLARAAAAVVVAANLACAVTHDLNAFIALRFLAGLGAGVLVVLGFASLGTARDPDRSFGVGITSALAYGAAALWFMPRMLHEFGFAIVPVCFAAFGLVALLASRRLPTGVAGSATGAPRGSWVSLPALAALGAMLCYFAGQGAAWSYFSLFGRNGGLTEVATARALSLAQFAGLGGALTVALLGAHRFRALALAGGIFAGILPLLWLRAGFSAAAFAVAAAIYNYGWNLTHPYLLGTMARFDAFGRVVVWAVAMQKIGLAIGPALAAHILTRHGYPGVMLVGAALMLASLVLVAAPALLQDRAASRSPTDAAGAP